MSKTSRLAALATQVLRATANAAIEVLDLGRVAALDRHQTLLEGVRRARETGHFLSPPSDLEWPRDK